MLTNKMTGSEKYFSKSFLSKGKGLENPNEGSRCIVNLHVSQGQNILHEEQNETWILGQDSGYVSEILNECIEDMHTGDICLVTLHLCNELQDHLQLFHTSENSAVDYRIELVSFEKAKNSWESSFHERYQFAWDEKEKGSRYYKADLLLFAARHYSKAVKSLILGRFHFPKKANGSQEFSLLEIQCYSNLAVCQLKLERYSHVVENSGKVLDVDSSNMKALFRRAKACIAINDFSQAEIDIKKALQLEPGNNEVICLKRTLDEKQYKHKTVTANAMSKMFQG